MHDGISSEKIATTNSPAIIIATCLVLTVVFFESRRVQLAACYMTDTYNMYLYPVWPASCVEPYICLRYARTSPVKTQSMYDTVLLRMYVCATIYLPGIPIK